MRPCTTLLVGGAILCLGWSFAAAAELTGDLECRVVAPDGALLSSAALRLVGANLPGERVGATRPDGAFTFLALPAGDYRVTAASPGLVESRLDAVRVHVGRATRVTLAMRLPSVEETIVVSAPWPLIDPTRTTTLETYTKDFFARARVDSQARRYQTVFGRPVGARADGTETWVRGSSRTENTYLLDGVDTTDPTYGSWGMSLSADAVEEMQVQTGGFAAEFGRATGGVVNLVTKSGGNDFAGTVDFRYRNENLMESGEYFDPSQSPVEQGYFDATLGGPVVRDKLWFFVALGRARRDTPYTGNTSTKSEQGGLFLGKLAWQVAPGHRLDFQWLGDPVEGDNVAGSQAAPEAQAHLEGGGTFASVQYQAVLESDFILQAQVARFNLRSDLTPMSGDVTTPGSISFLTGTVTGNYTEVALQDRTRDQVGLTTRWRLPGAGRHHTLKTGLDFHRTSFCQNRYFTGHRLDFVAPDATGQTTPVVSVLQDPAGPVENSADSAALFVQDEWRATRKLTLNIGLRYDRVSFDDDAGRQVFEAGLLQPRLGLAVDATEDARNVFKATASRYFYPGNLYVSEWANARVDTRYVYANEEVGGYFAGAGPTPLDLNGDGQIESQAYLQTYGGPGGWEFANRGHLAAPRVDEFSLGYERRLTAGSALAVTLVQRTSTDLIEDRGSGTGTLLIDNVSGLERTFRSAELRYQGQWAKAGLVASYAWTRNEGNAAEIATLGQDWDHPQTSLNRYGPLPGDLRSTIKADGFWSIGKGFELAYAYLYRSAFPYTIRRPVAPYGDDYVGGRGAGRGAAFSQLDAAVKKGFVVGRTTLSLIASVLNVLDREAVTVVSEAEATAGAPLQYQLPRYYELGLRWTF